MRRKPLIVVFFVAVLGVILSYQFVGRQAALLNIEDSAPDTVVKTIDNGLILQIIDKNQAPVYQLTFSNEFRSAQVEINANSLASESFVRILGVSGNLLVGEYTQIHDYETGVGYYFPETPKNYQVTLSPGTQIEVKADDVRFYSTLDGAEIPELLPLSKNEVLYIVSQAGLKKSDWSDDQAKSLFDQQFKRYAKQTINEYQTTIPEYVLHNKTLDSEKKALIQQLYMKLAPEDQIEYTEFLEQLQKGGTPTITYRGATEYRLGETVELLELFDIYDNEDGNIARDSLQIEGAVDFARSGSYDLRCTVTDKDGNVAQIELTITITEERVDVPSQTPNEEKPSLTPIEDNASDSSTEEPVVTDPELSGAGVGAGVVTDIAIADGETTVWGALEIEDHQNMNDNSGETEPVEREIAIVETTQNDSDPKVQGTTQATNIASIPDDEKSIAENIGGNIVLIVLGLLVACGLVKFISDHYVR